MNIPDKTHADWLLTTQECLIKRSHPSLSTKIEHFPKYDKRFLTIEQIPLNVFKELRFIVNTDTNNNYLYIETIKIYVNGSCTPVEIIGVEDTLNQLYNFSDMNAFIEGSKTHTPWVTTTIPEFNLTTYIENQISILPPQLRVTTNDIICFDLVLNPDKKKKVPLTEL